MAYSAKNMEIGQEVKSSSYQLQNLKTHARNRPHCSFCNNHGKKEVKQNHKCYYEKKCSCILCTLTRKAQTLMKHQQRVWRFKNQINKVNDIERYQKCDNCRNHQEFVRKSNHDCPREDCQCELCTLSGQRRKVMKHLQRARRLGVTQESTCDTDISVAVNNLTIEEESEGYRTQEIIAGKSKTSNKNNRTAATAEKETAVHGNKNIGMMISKRPKVKCQSTAQRCDNENDKINKINYDMQFLNIMTSQANGASTSKEANGEIILPSKVIAKNNFEPSKQKLSCQATRVTDTLTPELRDGIRHSNNSHSLADDGLAGEMIRRGFSYEPKKEDNYLSFLNTLPSEDAGESLTAIRHYQPLSSDFSRSHPPSFPYTRNDAPPSINSLIKPIPLLGAPVVPYWPPVFPLPQLIPNAQDYYHSLLRHYFPASFPLHRSPPW